MNIFVEKSQENKELAFNGTVQQLLKKLNINPETVIVSRNNELVISTDLLSTTDTIKILSVISGG